MPAAFLGQIPTEIFLITNVIAVIIAACPLLWREISPNTGDRCLFHDPQIQTRFTNVYEDL